jgi:hypothetical protein
MMKYIMAFANNPVFRYLLGWSMPPKFSLLKLMRQKILPQEQNLRYVLQVRTLRCIYACVIDLIVAGENASDGRRS